MHTIYGAEAANTAAYSGRMEVKMLKKIIASALTLTSLLTSLTAFADGVAESSTLELFVATDGDDRNNGSFEKPYATIQAAADAATVEKGKKSDLQVIINVKGGNYFLKQGITLNEALSGTEEKPLIIQNYNGEEVNLRGSVQIDPMDFHKCTDEKVLKRIPESARQYIGEYDLSKVIFGSMDNFTYPLTYGSDTGYYSILLNEREQTLARWPNTGYSTVVSSSNKWNFDVEPENAKRWTSAENPIVSGFFKVKYLREFRRASRISENGNIILERNAWYGILPGDRYYIFNLIEELDSPGEYYIDKMSKKLYFYPPYTISNAFIEIPILKEAILDISKLKNITVKGINFKATRGNGINADSTENFVLDHCKIENVGNVAMNASNTSKLKIINNDFFHIGAKCIIVSGGDRNKLISSENLIENNHFFNFAKNWPTYNPAIDLNGVGTTIQHNIMHESSSQGIMFGGNDHKINYNEMYNLVKEVTDAGAIYSVRNTTYRGNEIAYNYIHDIDTSANKNGSIYVAAVYLDDLFSSANVHHNVLARCHLGVMFGGGRDNNFDNNIVVDCENSMFMDARGVGWAAYHANVGGQVYNSIFQVPYNQPPWSTRYPELASIFDHGKLGLPYNNSIQHNLIYNAKSTMIANEMYEYSKVDYNTYTENQPEIFKDYTDNNFEIADGAEILKTNPKLAEIDMSKVGLSEDRVKESTEQSLNAGFRLIAPKNGAKNISNLGYLFKWDKHDGSDKYIVRIADDPEMKNVIIEEETVNNYLEIKNIPTGEKIFYWTVTGVNFSQSLKNTFKQIGAPRMLTSYQYELTDKTQLEKDVQVCQNLYDKMIEGTDKGTYKVGFKSKTKAVLDNAIAVNNSALSLQADIVDASKQINDLITSVPDNFNYDVVNIGDFIQDKDNWFYGAGPEAPAGNGFMTWNKDGSMSLTGENGRKNHYYICGYDKDLGQASAVKFGYKVNVSSNYCIIGLQEKFGFLTVGNGYNLIIKSNQIEIQKCTSGYAGDRIKNQILNFYISDNKWVDLEMGALCVGVGTYVYLKADGFTIASFLDTDEPYWNPEATKFIFTNPSGVMPECYASIRAAKD